MVARRAAALLLAAALATGLAACGGGDDEDSSDEVRLEDVESDANGSASSSDDDDEADSSDDEEASDEEEATDEIDEEADDAIAGAFSEGCADFTQVFGALGGAIAGTFDEEAAAQFEQFVEDAPDAIRDDLETFAGAFEDYAAALEDAGIDLSDPNAIDPSNSEALQVLIEAAESFNSAEVQEASSNINDFIASGCEG